MGKFDDSIEIAKGIAVPAKGQRATPSLSGVNEALASVTSAMAGSPVLVSSGKYADSIQKAKDIAAGKKDTSGGIGGLFGATIGKGLEGIGYVAGLPARTVTSVVKEVSDALSPGGDNFSFKELVTQPFQSDFYMSKFIPKTGNKWLDVAVGLGVDVLSDPLTYIAPTAVMGRAQRLALAAKAGEASVIAKAPTLANKLDDIVRYGEWALDDVEREALNIPKGLRWQYGQNNPVFDPNGIMGKASGLAAEAIGKPFASVRATIGDIPALNRVQGFVRPRSYGGALNKLGRRGALDGVDILKEVSRYSAGVRFRAQRGLIQQMLLADNEALLKELDSSPFRNTVFEVIEGTADRTGRVVSAEERDLADRITNLFQGARDEANKFTRQFATKRGVDADYVGFVDNYFHGSLSDEAQKFVSGRNFGKGKFDGELAKTLDIAPMEFVTGPTILRGRTLKAGEKWLGKVLEFGDKAEINAISRKELGFDWFKTDARSVVSDYIENVGKQTGRIAFVDRLFDYGTDVVDKLLPKMIPDTELVNTAKASYRKLNSAYNRIANKIDRLERSATATAKRVAGRAESASARGTEAGAVLREDIAGITQDVADARKALANGRRRATLKSKEVRAAFDNAVAPLEARIIELENILKSGADREELAATVLKDLHVRAFPDVADELRPTKYADLAKEIKSGATEKYNARMAELAPIEDAGGNINRQVGAAQGQYTKTLKASEGAQAEIKAARESTKGVKAELKTAKAEVARQKRVMEKAIKDDPVVKNVKSLEAAHVRAVNSLKAKEALLAKQVDWENTVKPELMKTIDAVRDVSAPSATARAKGSLTTHGGTYLLDKATYYADSEVLRAAKQAFRDLPDDEYVWVFHATDDPTGIVGAGRVQPFTGTRKWDDTLSTGLYVAATPEVGTMYGENVIALRVRKGDIVNSAENSMFGSKYDVADGLFYSPDGAVLPEGTAYESVLVWSPEISARNWGGKTFQQFNGDAPYRKLLSDAGVVAMKGEPPLIPTPLKGDYLSLSRRWVDDADRLLNAIDNPRLFKPEERDAWARTFTSLKAAEAEFGRIAGDKNYANAIINALSDPTSPLYGKMVNDVKEGWAALERLGIQLPQDTKDMLFNGIEKFGKVDEVRQFLKIFDRYNQFFRVTAMLNPGFVVRNAYTAAFNNFVYGVTLADTNDAIRFATNLHRRGIREALAGVSATEREIYERAYKGIIASGAGQIKDISTMPITDGFVGKLLNSRLVKVWGTANSDAEVGARMAMALRAARNGDNIDQIATTVARYHFDYSDLSKLDEIAKVFVPFWTFASRNIPLQIMNQIARPSMYRAYESAKRNMPVDEGMILPSWLAEREPLGFGAGGVLNPDLPQVDMMSQIRQLSDPLRLLSQLYPQYRLPIELAGNRQLSLDIPFSDKPSAIEGPFDLPALLAGLLTGQTVDTAGGPAVSSKTSYAVTSALPTLGLLQRLLPQGGGEDKYKDRQLSSVISTLTGAPYRQVTQKEQENELLRRQFALRDLLDSLQNRGYVE